MSKIAWGRFSLLVGVLGVAGYYTMKWATPTAEEYYDALAPDLKKKVDERRAILENEATSNRIRAEQKKGSRIVWANNFQPDIPTNHLRPKGSPSS